jgi:hypothetical protein
MTMKRPAITPVLLAILFGGCVTPQTLPEMSEPQSSALGIEIILENSDVGPDRVYFVRIDNEDGPLQQKIYPSNYYGYGASGSAEFGTPAIPPRAYLLNARPGTYVAVAALRVERAMGSGTVENTWYFSKQSVELTKVIVRENDFAYMGSYAIGSSRGLDGTDEVQTHYKNVIAPEAPESLALMMLYGNFHRLGTLVEYKKDDLSRDAFFLRAKEDLAGSGWAKRFK